jgi:hypothetical protein
MNASDPANNKLTDEQLDALLESADQELLLHIQASTDPTAILTGLLAIPVHHEDGYRSRAPGGPASEPGHPVHTQRTGSRRRSWRAIRVAAAAVAVAGAAAVTISIATGHAAHHPTSAVSSRTVPTVGIAAPAPARGPVAASGSPAVDHLSRTQEARLTTANFIALSHRLCERSSPPGTCRQTRRNARTSR